MVGSAGKLQAAGGHLGRSVGLPFPRGLRSCPANVASAQAEGNRECGGSMSPLGVFRWWAMRTSSFSQLFVLFQNTGDSKVLPGDTARDAEASALGRKLWLAPYFSVLFQSYVSFIFIFNLLSINFLLLLCVQLSVEDRGGAIWSSGTGITCVIISCHVGAGNQVLELWYVHRLAFIRFEVSFILMWDNMLLLFSCLWKSRFFQQHQLNRLLSPPPSAAPGTCWQVIVNKQLDLLLGFLSVPLVNESVLMPALCILITWVFQYILQSGKAVIFRFVLYVQDCFSHLAFSLVPYKF